MITGSSVVERACIAAQRYLLFARKIKNPPSVLFAGQRYREARSLLDSTLASPSTCADTIGFICDTLSTEAEGGNLPKSLAQALAITLTKKLEDRHIMSLDEWKKVASPVPHTSPAVEAWWNLNGSAGDSVVALVSSTLNPSMHAMTIDPFVAQIFHCFEPSQPYTCRCTVILQK